MYERYAGAVCVTECCNARPRCRQLCQRHYAEALRTGAELPATVRAYEECSEAGCERTKSARGLCAMHYKRATRPRPLPPEERFWTYVDRTVESGCHEWTGSRNATGYGYFKADYVSYSAHRYSWWLRYGEIPSRDLHIDHLCRNTRCVNTDHLEVVTPAENLARSPIAPSTVNAAKTECVNGHAFDALNTHVDRRGWRRCRTCAADRARMAYQRQKAVA